MTHFFFYMAPFVRISALNTRHDDRSDSSFLHEHSRVFIFDFYLYVFTIGKIFSTIKENLITERTRRRIFYCRRRAFPFPIPSVLAAKRDSRSLVRDRVVQIRRDIIQQSAGSFT